MTTKTILNHDRNSKGGWEPHAFVRMADYLSPDTTARKLIHLRSNPWSSLDTARWLPFINLINVTFNYVINPYAGRVAKFDTRFSRMNTDKQRVVYQSMHMYWAHLLDKMEWFYWLATDSSCHCFDVVNRRGYYPDEKLYSYLYYPATSIISENPSHRHCLMQPIDYIKLTADRITTMFENNEIPDEWINKSVILHTLFLHPERGPELIRKFPQHFKNRTVVRAYVEHTEVMDFITNEEVDPLPLTTLEYVKSLVKKENFQKRIGIIPLKKYLIPSTIYDKYLKAVTAQSIKSTRPRYKTAMKLFNERVIRNAR